MRLSKTSRVIIYKKFLLDYLVGRHCGSEILTTYTSYGSSVSMLNFTLILIIKFISFYNKICYFSFWLERVFYHLPVGLVKAILWWGFVTIFFLLPAPFIFLSMKHHYLIKSTIKLARTNIKIAISIGIVFFVKSKNNCKKLNKKSSYKKMDLKKYINSLKKQWIKHSFIYCLSISYQIA